MTVASDLADFAAAVAQIGIDSELYTQLVSGPSSGEGSIVHTEGGDVKTLPRILSELETLYTSFVSDEDLPPDSAADGIVTRPVGVLTLLGQILTELASLSITIDPGDVEIGAVELKDGATDNRAIITNADLAVNSTVYALAVRVVGLLATLGEVGASPTANTILDRLKTIAANTLGGGAGTPAGGVYTVQPPRLGDNGYQQITSLMTVQTLTVPANTIECVVQGDVSDIRFLLNGNSPSATVGNLLAVGDRLGFNSQQAAALKFIGVDAGAILDIQYLKVV